MTSYDPNALGIKPPAGGFQQGGWYAGRQYWGGTLSAPGVIHDSSNQQGAGQLVSAEVNLQSDAAQGNQPGDIERYLAAQRASQPATAQPVTAPQRSVNTNAATSAGGTVSGMGAGGFAPQATPDLSQIHKGLYDSSGITAAEKDLSEKEKAFTEIKANINDNPYLSEATRTGRIAKLEELHADRTKNLRDDIAVKRADVETQMALQLKQIDINSDAAKMAMDQFKMMLDSGMLANADGDTLAWFIRTTGMPGSMLQAAVAAQKQKDIKTEMIKWDDGKNQGYTLINSATGETIKSAIVAKSEPSASAKAATGINNMKTNFINDANSAVKSGEGDIFKRLVQTYAATGLSLPEIYQLYYQTDAYKYFGSPQEDPTDMATEYVNSGGPEAT